MSPAKSHQDKAAAPTSSLPHCPPHCHPQPSIPKPRHRHSTAEASAGALSRLGTRTARGSSGVGRGRGLGTEWGHPGGGGRRRRSPILGTMGVWFPKSLSFVTRGDSRGTLCIAGAGWDRGAQRGDGTAHQDAGEESTGSKNQHSCSTRVRLPGTVTARALGTAGGWDRRGLGTRPCSCGTGKTQETRRLGLMLGVGALQLR